MSRRRATAIYDPDRLLSNPPTHSPFLSGTTLRPPILSTRDRALFYRSATRNTPCRTPHPFAHRSRRIPPAPNRSSSATTPPSPPRLLPTCATSPVPPAVSAPASSPPPRSSPAPPSTASSVPYTPCRTSRNNPPPSGLPSCRCSPVSPRRKTSSTPPYSCRYEYPGRSPGSPASPGARSLSVSPTPTSPAGYCGYVPNATACSYSATNTRSYKYTRSERQRIRNAVPAPPRSTSPASKPMKSRCSGSPSPHYSPAPPRYVLSGTRPTPVPYPPVTCGKDG